MVWTEITTESGTMMVLRPAADADPSGSDTAAEPGSDVSSLESIGGPRPSLRPTPAYAEPVYPGGAPPHLPGISSFGVYSGFPSTVGFQFAIPTDASVAFRTGFTGLPGIGYLLTPGIELRFGQTAGTYNVDSGYTFSNLYIGETVEDGPNSKHWGLESGIGYRWILPDRRGVRWVAAVEFGGRWTTESAFPTKPSVRAFWMVAAP
jgi:hypothetical protein